MVKLPIIFTDNVGMDNYLDFYERVKTLSKVQGVTVRSVIESCGINYDSYNSYKRYGNLPRTDESLAIAKALKTTVEYLVTGESVDCQKEINDLKKKVLDFANSL